MAPLHDTVVADLGRLGQAGGSRGIDIECGGCRSAAARTPTPAGHRRETPEFGRERGANPALLCPCTRQVNSRGQPGADRRQPRRELGADDDGLRCDDIDRVDQRVAGQIGIDEGNHGADARQAQPDRQVFGAVGHHQAHGIPALETLGKSPPRILMAAGRELAVAQGGLARHERRRRSELIGPAGRSVPAA